MDWLVVELAGHIEVFGDRFKSDKLSQAGECLNFCELRGRHIALKLQELQFDLEQIALAHVAGFVARLTDIDRLLKTRCVLFRKIESRLREQHGYELLARVEDQ